jgi:hypothetical protein
MGKRVEDWKSELPQSFRDRSRVSIYGSDVSTYYSTGAAPDKSILYAAGSSSRIVDVNHPQWHQIRRLRSSLGKQSVRNLDLGHPLAIERVELTMPSVIHTQVNITRQVKGYYDGVFAPSVDYKNSMNLISMGKFPGIPVELGVDRLALWGLGSTAIARSLPDVPDFSLFRFIGELRAGLPQIPLQALKKEKKLRNVGGEYLNYQFGVAPLVSDVQKLFEQLMDPQLRKHVKHALHEEHRVRKTIDKGRTSSSRALSATEMTVMPSSFTSGMKGTRETISEYRIWSSVSFAYYQANLLDELLADLDRMTGGLGVVPNAVDLWNLIPWSWFVDWFTNINHVLTNLSYLGRDGLYLQRGYLMGHYRERIIDTQSRVFMGTPISTTGVRTFERKYRVRASPFGFGYTWKEFNPFQLSILSALGVSRLRY